MVIGIGLIVVVAVFIVSVVLALLPPATEIRSPLLWAMWAVALALILGVHVAV